MVPIVILIDTDTHVGDMANPDDRSVLYLSKPFRISELIILLRSQIRWHEASENGEIKIGRFIFQPANKVLLNLDENRKIQLTDKETAILKLLSFAGDEIVQRSTLLKEVWGYNKNITTHTLETHIYRLRQKIEVDPPNAKILLTLPGGYSLAINN